MSNEDEARRRYSDIINLPRPEPSRPRMTRMNRAAQFAPFAAMVGYDDATKEEARLTNDKIELSEDMKDILDAKMQILEEHIESRPEISVTYFIADKKKTGGSYQTVSGRLKRIDEYNRALVMEDRSVIAIDDVLDIVCELFNSYESF